MAITFTLTERTPYRLRYLATSGGTTPIETGILVNRNSTTPDLRGDAGVELGSPIWNLVSTGVANQAAARKLMFGDTLVLVTDIEIPRGHIDLHQRNSTITTQKWSVDANEGAAAGDAQSAGFAVLVVNGSSVAFDQAYIDIYYEHSFDR